MKAQTMRRLRQLHHYVGVLIAPTIILFALSGAFQTFRWQEAKGYGGAPPGWIVWMASVHIDQALPKAEPREVIKDGGKAADDKAAPAKKPPKKRAAKLALKAFVAVAAVGLLLSSLLGITIALNNRSTRRISLLMLTVGTALPLMLLFI